MRAYLPCVLLPDSSNSIFSFSLSSSTTSLPRSQGVTVPAPWYFCGISPSKSAYSSGWFSVWMASRFISCSAVVFWVGETFEDSVDLKPEVVVV